MEKEEKINIVRISAIVIIAFLLLFSLYETVLKNTKYYTVVNGELHKFEIINKFNGNTTKEAANTFLQEITDGKYNINNAVKTKSVKAGEPYLEIIDDNFELKVNIISDKVIYYRDKNFEIIEESNINEEQAKENMENIKAKYNISGEYTIRLIEPTNLGLWHAEICKKENDIFNIYKSIKIDFIPQLEKIVFLEFKDYIYTNNEAVISREEAENIAKTAYEEEDILEIKSEAAIEQVTDRKISSDVNYGDEIELENASDLITYMDGFKENRQIRNVWEVQIVNDDGRTAIYDIDRTSGTLIRKAFM